MSRIRRLSRSAAGSAGGAITAQMVTAGGSFVLQVAAARLLGAAGYGRYALCVALIVTFTALHTGYVGDSLTVLDRMVADVRAAIVASGLGSLALGLAGGATIGLLLGLAANDALLLGLLVALWLTEETGRRLLMARLEFWKLVANDSLYMVVTVGVLATALLLGAPATLALFLGAMSAGAVAAVVMAVVQLPRSELARLRPRTAGLRDVAAFATWRSAQAGLRPTSLLAARLLVLHLVSAAAVGQLEAARLLVAPAQTVINGAGSFLLSTFAVADRDTGRGRAGRRKAQQKVSAAVWLLCAGTLLTGAVSLVLLEPLTRIVTGGDFEIPALAFLGWIVYVTTWAVTLPYVSETVVRRLSRQVFLIRVVDSVVGVVLVAIALGLDQDLLVWVPWLLSVGGVVGAVLLRRLAINSRHRVRPLQLRTMA